MTPLHWASFYKRPNHAKLLLMKGAQEEVVDVDGKVRGHRHMFCLCHATLIHPRQRDPCSTTHLRVTALFL